MNSQGGLTLSKKDLITFQVIQDFREGKLSRREAALKLGCTERTISRKTRTIAGEGLPGLVHKNRGRRPSNRKHHELREWYLGIFRTKYAPHNFNFKHAFQFINEQDHPQEAICYSTFATWCRESGLGKGKKRRRTSKTRLMRERSANEGLMLQMDGSPHAWNGKDTWTMLTIIDDATSKVEGCKFVPSETTWDCMDLLKQVVATRGIPEFILTDRAGWSARTGKRVHFSQFDRACKELGITVIATSVPESKGRVERSFRTSQDRLIAELSLHEIKSMTDANRYLEHVYKPDWNNRFTVEQKSPTTRYKPLPAHLNLDEVFCIKHTRQVNRNHTVSFEGRIYSIKDPPQNLWKHDVVVHQDRLGKIKIFWGSRPLAIEERKVPKRIYRMYA